MNSMERVLTALSHQEPDRVPLFLLLTLHGARALGLSIRSYFGDAEAVIEGQIALHRRFGHDCLYPFFYAALEVEAMGGEVLFVEDGPPNAGAPIFTADTDLTQLRRPEVKSTPCLARVLKTIEGLRRYANDTVPIIGVVMSPFSLPVMQLGFDTYLDLMLEEGPRFWSLMRFNEDFCTSWANAQLEAGATAICYFDPIASPTVVSPAHYRRTGWEVARRTLKAIKGPTATHLASGRALRILDDLALTGTAVVGVSAQESLTELKAASRGRLTLLGTLNALLLRHSTPEETRAMVKSCLSEGAPGGGFILSDNHGEIPWQVPETTLDIISETVRSAGTYPICHQS